MPLTFINAFRPVNVSITILVMRRTLVLTSENARHPFRQSLPRHVFAVVAEAAKTPRAPDADDQDWKLFVLSFVAFFTVAYTFIA